MGYLGPGQRLREIREGLSLTLKEVETQSRQLAEDCQNPQYLFTAGRLSQIENSSSLPSIYKLAALSRIYRTPYGELLRLYGIETTEETLSVDLHEDSGNGTSREAKAREEEVGAGSRYVGARHRPIP